MGLLQSSLPFSLVTLFVLFFTVSGSSDYTTLVFKGCADQKFQDLAGYQNLKTLFDTLKSQSSVVKFYNYTAGDGASAITGLFQCRGDLSGDDCSRCVGKAPDLSQKLCGATVAARVQLNGCYLRYEVAGFRQVPGTEMLYKVCGSRVSASGFDDRLGAALGEVEKGVESGSGFYAGGYESVYVMGQCEGDLGTGDCGDCVKSAVEKAKSECSGSISGQIYLLQCYISYTYYPNGVPSQATSESEETGHSTQKTVAIVVGGVAGFGLGISFLLFLKSAFKKRSETKYGG